MKAGIMKVKTEAFQRELAEMIERMEKEGRFWQTFSEIGFKRENAIIDMETVTHYSLPISTSFIMDKKTFMILAFTWESSWLYPKGAYYVGEDGVNYVRHPLTIPVMTCENFIRWHVRRVRLLTEEILSKLDSRIL